LCGINRPHARYWSRTNRIDSILESPPVTSDTATVPPPTRSPEPKVTRYIVIRNDQHDGSSHHGKIFIVAGNRPAPGWAPGKAIITFRNHLARRALTTRVAHPSRGPLPEDFSGSAGWNASLAQAFSRDSSGPTPHSATGLPLRAPLRASAGSAWPAAAAAGHPLRMRAASVDRLTGWNSADHFPRELFPFTGSFAGMCAAKTPTAIGSQRIAVGPLDLGGLIRIIRRAGDIASPSFCTRAGDLSGGTQTARTMCHSAIIGQPRMHTQPGHPQQQEKPHV
jgi:hypothetical protein